MAFYWDAIIQMPDVQNIGFRWALLLAFFVSSIVVAAPGSALKQLYTMPKASLYLGGMPEYNLRPQQPMIPASTLKILTALLALDHWGAEHHFITDFYLDPQQRLWIKGYGDPYLTSEELDKIVSQLKRNGLTRIAGVGIDSHYFVDHLAVDGRSGSNNPYDAPLSAVAVNFNTIAVVRDKTGIYSGEAQTPSTALMRQLAHDIDYGKQRINLKQQRHGGQYFAQVLIEKLTQQGIEVEREVAGEKIVEGQVAATTALYYRHYNSKTLEQMVAGMLKYSNNFIANQLFMLLGAERFGAPANMQKAQKAYAEAVKQRFGWDKRFYEGAGLSRNNQLTSTELVTILDQFAPYKHLLKQQNKRILAKTGTLSGVSSYAGYLYRYNRWVPFAIIINQPINGYFRKRLALELLQ